MEWVYIFNTVGRSGFGKFYLDFMSAVDPSFLTNSDNPFVIAMLGARGKSLAADVAFHYVLDHLDPMDIIEGEEVRHMYLEDRPKDAIHRPLFDHGCMKIVDGAAVDLSLMFINQPIPEIFGRSRYNGSVEDRDNITAQCLNTAFKEGKRGSVGGLIFVSGFATFDHADVTISMEGGAHDNWEAEHTIYVNSEKLKNSERFRQGWEKLKTTYKSRNALEYRQ